MSRKVDAELDVNVVRESHNIGAFGKEEFINEVLGHSITKGKRDIKFSDVVAVAKIEFHTDISEIKKGPGLRYCVSFLPEIR